MERVAGYSSCRDHAAKCSTHMSRWGPNIMLTEQYDAAVCAQWQFTYNLVILSPYFASGDHFQPHAWLCVSAQACHHTMVWPHHPKRASSLHWQYISVHSLTSHYISRQQNVRGHLCASPSSRKLNKLHAAGDDTD
jgi:hypothetical protein